MSDYLPAELIVEILIRVPAKIVPMCKCVCKRWNSLISNPHFATTYLAHSKQRPYHLFRRLDQETGEELFTLHPSDNPDNPFPRNYHLKNLNRSDPALHINLLRLAQEVKDKGGFFGCSSDYIKLHCPYKFKTRYYQYFHEIVGSVNGLICMVDSDSCSIDNYYLWNPSINRSMKLPRPKYHDQSRSNSFFGFGYHAPTDDYKLVRLVNLKNCNSPVVDIYTLNTGGWCSAKAQPSAQYIIDSFGSVVVNGALHWLAHTPEDAHHNLIVSFDLGNEGNDVVFNEVPVPKILEGAPPLSMMNIAVLNGLLTLHGGQPEQSVDRGGREDWLVKEHAVWVMKEYNVVKSWTKLYVIDVGENFVRVVGFKKNGELLITMEDDKDKGLLLYAPNSRRGRPYTDLYISGLSRSFYLDYYVESLVLLKKNTEK